MEYSFFQLDRRIPSLSLNFILLSIIINYSKKEEIYRNKRLSDVNKI